MRDNQTEGTPIATPNPAKKPRRRRRVIFMPEFALKRQISARDRRSRTREQGPLRQVSLTFEARGALRRPLSRKEFLFDPPTGPGGRRSTPDSAVRPRAQTCLEDRTTALFD